jgi:hypothetical protein
MAKLTTQEPREYTINDPIHIQLGPPSEEFVLCEQEFIVQIKEYLWPGHLPYTEEQIASWIRKGSNPRSPTWVIVKQAEEESFTTLKGLPSPVEGQFYFSSFINTNRKNARSMQKDWNYYNPVQIVVFDNEN